MTSDTPVPAEILANEIPHRLIYDAQGLVPVVAQDAETSEVVLLAYMNVEALDTTLATGALTLWSRSRGALWRKGETSGQTLRVRELRVNCESNSLLARVTLEGVGVCHEGFRSCYYRTLIGSSAQELTARVVETRVFDPEAVYGEGYADATALERDARTLYTSYERLRDAPRILGSNTSRLLRSNDAPMASGKALARAVEELEELRGVVAGTHQHFGDKRDVALEASQVSYWVMVAAVALRLPYDAWQPHRAWLAGWEGVALTAMSDMEDAHAALAAPLWEAGALCRAAGVHPARAAACDLTEMRARHGDTGEQAAVGGTK